MKKTVTKSVHSLHGKFQNIVRMAGELEKIPRKFGTDMEISSTEIHTIELIAENQDLSVTDLAKLQGVTKGAISQNVKRLENKNLVTKEEDPVNISRSILKLTNQGNVAYYSHKLWHEKLDGGFKEYFLGLDQGQIEFLEQVLEKIETFLKQRILTEK